MISHFWELSEEEIKQRTSPQKISIIFEKNTVRIVAIDFDDTVIFGHIGSGWWANHLEMLTEARLKERVAYVEKNINGEKKKLTSVDVIKNLKQLGYHVIICSFAKDAVIEKFMNSAMGENWRDTIDNVLAFNYRNKRNLSLSKVEILDTYCKELKSHSVIVNPEEIVVLDDEVNNLRTLQESGYQVINGEVPYNMTLGVKRTDYTIFYDNTKEEVSTYIEHLYQLATPCAKPLQIESQINEDSNAKIHV